jgi:SAM-dependent methyltransferase
MSEELSHYREMWDRKAVLRLVYDDMFQRIADCAIDGPTLELGGGVGNLKAKIPSLISSDIQFAPWLDLVTDAQQLPFASGCLANIVMLDVLHHVEFCSLLFREASRVLRPGGRMVLVEPGITFGSTLFYRLLHHEPVVMNVDPLEEGTPDRKRDPYHSNQAIPTLLATRYREQFHRKFPDLRIRETRWLSFVAYPFSGGFKPWSFIGERTARNLLSVERKLEPFLGRLLGFRLLMVIEKRQVGNQLP